MKPRYVHLGINPVGAVAHLPNAQWPANFLRHLEFYLAMFVGDWYRYGAQNYMLWTSADLAEMTKGIMRLPGFQNVYVLATEVADPYVAVNGWMPPQFWSWLHKPR